MKTNIQYLNSVHCQSQIEFDSFFKNLSQNFHKILAENPHNSQLLSKNFPRTILSKKHVLNIFIMIFVSQGCTTVL
jgi:hypothetical protein